MSTAGPTHGLPNQQGEAPPPPSPRPELANTGTGNVHDIQPQVASFSADLAKNASQCEIALLKAQSRCRKLKYYLGK